LHISSESTTYIFIAARKINYCILEIKGGRERGFDVSYTERELAGDQAKAQEHGREGRSATLHKKSDFAYTC
jgi:hypothetical protein